MSTNTLGVADLAQRYDLAAVLGAAGSSHPFRRSLADVATGRGDAIYALGDDEVRVFTAGLNFARAWPTPADATCLAVDADKRVAVRSPGRVDLYDATGRHTGGFVAGNAGEPAAVTSIKFFRSEILIGDADARCVRRYDRSGRPLGTVGNRDRTRGFMLPNRSVDFDIDPMGLVYATDSGRHRVATWAIDGSPVGSFGTFGFERPEDFVGCCNPVNLALGPGGTIVTGEKMIARVKVYSRDGRLLALISPAHFDQSTTHLHLAVDSKGRILAGDPVRREAKIFAPSA